MITKTVKNKLLFSWTASFNQADDDEVGTLWIYPNSDTLLKIKLDDVSVDTMKGCIQQIKAWMEQSHELNGEVLEKWEKQQVETPPGTKEEWVQVT